ncbi:hypothetical protein EMCRGX_G011160 [Ephydatia muelleri]
MADGNDPVADLDPDRNGSSDDMDKPHCSADIPPKKRPRPQYKTKWQQNWASKYPSITKKSETLAEWSVCFRAFNFDHQGERDILRHLAVAAALPPPPAAALPPPPPAEAAAELPLPPPPAAVAALPPAATSRSRSTAATTTSPTTGTSSIDTSAPTTTSPAAPLAAATTTHMAPMARTRPLRR